MKLLFHLSLLGLLLLLISASPVTPWVTYTSADSTWSIQFPGQPSHDSDPSYIAPQTGIGSHGVMYISDDITFAVSIYDFIDPTLSEMFSEHNPDAPLDYLDSTTDHYLSRPTVELISRRYVSSSTFKGVEFEVIEKQYDSTIHKSTRVFIVGNRLFTLSVFAPDLSSIQSDIDLFFSSFTICQPESPPSDPPKVQSIHPVT